MEGKKVVAWVCGENETEAEPRQINSRVGGDLLRIDDDESRELCATVEAKRRDMVRGRERKGEWISSALSVSLQASNERWLLPGEKSTEVDR